MRRILAVLFAFMVLMWSSSSFATTTSHRSTGDRASRRLSRQETQFVRAELKVARPRGRGPKWGAIAIRYLGGNDKELQIQIFRVNASGRISNVAEESYTLLLGGGGDFRWERARYGRGYLVRAIDLVSGQTVLQQTYVPIRDYEGYVLTIADDGTPPAAQQLANLQHQIDGLQAQLGDAGTQNTALQSQVTVLQSRVDSLQAALAQTDVHFVVTASTLGAASGRARTGMDDLFDLAVSSTAQYDSPMDAFEFAFDGPTLAGIGYFTAGLVDANSNWIWQVNCYADAAGKCTGTIYPSYYLATGTTKHFKLRLNSSSFLNQTNVADGLKVVLKNVTSYNGAASYGLQAPVTAFDGNYE